MDLGFVSCNFLFNLIFLLSCIVHHGYGSREFNHHQEQSSIEMIKKQDLDHNHHQEQSSIEMIKKQDLDHHKHGSSHMDHMDSSLLVFFTLKDLKIGKTMPIYFPKRDASKSPHFLPRDEASSIPFSSKHLSSLLKLFSFPQGSHQAKAMENTLRECESEPISGETKSCVTSLESMLDFIRGVFGPDSKFQVLTTTHLSKSDIQFQNYTILEAPRQIIASEMVACHTLPYPYAVFYCHGQKSENRAFKVSLGGENGDKVDALAVCHMDTSHWGRDHVSFRVLGIEPGSSHVCHFFPSDNFVWVPITSLNQ